MNLIDARNLSERFGGHSVLRDVSLSTEPGEIVTNVGPNGSGNSTFLRVLIGSRAPSEGSLPRKDGLRLGHLPQKLNIDPTLPTTVYQLMRLTRHDNPDRIREALAQTSVEALATRQVSSLSGGQFQRVMLARALLTEPQLLVLDEGHARARPARHGRLLPANRGGPTTARLRCPHGQPRSARGDERERPGDLSRLPCLLSWRAALAGLGLAIATALGCFVVWRRMAYFGDATTHAAILGVALSLTFETSIFAGVQLVAGGSVLAGLQAPFHFDTPTGPTIICVTAIHVVLSLSVAGLLRTHSRKTAHA